MTRWDCYEISIAFVPVLFYGRFLPFLSFIGHRRFDFTASLRSWPTLLRTSRPTHQMSKPALSRTQPCLPLSALPAMQFGRMEEYRTDTYHQSGPLAEKAKRPHEKTMVRHQAKRFLHGA